MGAKERFTLNKARAEGLICIILLMCESLVIAGEVAKELVDTQTLGTQTIIPELTIEYKPSKGEEVVDIIFDVATMTVKEAKGLEVKGLEQRKTTQIVNVKYPKVVMIKDKDAGHYYGTLIKSIKFLNIKGEIINERKLKLMEVIERTIHNIEELKKREPDTFEDVVILRESQIIGVMERLYHVGKDGIKGINKVIFYNKDGEEIIEYKFDKGKVGNIIFDLANISVKEAKKLGMEGLEKTKETEIVKLPYSKVILEGETVSDWSYDFTSIKFLNWKGNIKKEIPVQERVHGKQSAANITFSENKKYLAVTRVKKWGEKRGIEEVESEILNTDGDILWKVKHPFYYIDVSPNGKYVMGCDVECGDSPLEIFYENGVVKKIEKDDQAWGVKFSKDGSWCVVSVETFDPTKSGIEKYRKHLIAMDEKGNELWRKDNIAQGDDASFSKITAITDDDIVIFTIYEISDPLKIKTVYRFDKKGNLISK